MRAVFGKHTITLLTLLAGDVLGQTVQRPVILADTNRDGVVDMADNVDKQTWTWARGAIFLPNVGDTYHRCHTEDMDGNPLSNKELSACHDASGDMLIEPSLVAPLKTMPIEVGEDAYAHIYTNTEVSYENVRLFVNDFPEKANVSSSWRLVDESFFFNASQIRAGIQLGIDGRTFVTDATEWDGHAKVQFDLFSNGSWSRDTVALKVAPILTHHPLQAPDTLISTAANESKPLQLEFLKHLDQGREAAGIKTPLLLLNQTDDAWVQDIFEAAYASMPGPQGPISIRIMMRSAQSTRDSGREVFRDLRGKGIGGFQPLGGRGVFGKLDVNGLGNLETIPPYTSTSGVKYPAGRVILGKHHQRYPAESILTFLKGQGMQKPLILEAGWLLVGHVDEFVQFIPTNNTDLGFTIAIADTTSALDILRDAQNKGHGDVRAMSFNGSLANSFKTTEEDAKTTVTEILSNTTFLEVNEYAQRYIDDNLDLLLADIPLRREDVIRVPSLFKNLHLGDWNITFDTTGIPFSGDEVKSGEWRLVSFSPAAINGIVAGQHYLSPKPWGPIVNGVDIFEKGVREAYGKAGMQVSMVEDFLSHHVLLGEIHCGSNLLRDAAVEWWL